MPTATEDHFANKHPGKIINHDLIHHEPNYLKGTGTGIYESEVIDTYLHSDTRERMHFEFVSEDIWNFLKSRYDCDYTIKRYYTTKGSYSVFNELDARLKLIPFFFAKADDLYAGNLNEDNFQIYYIQLSAKKSFGYFKKRVADVLTAQLKQKGDSEEEDDVSIKPEDIRLWLCNRKDKLISSFSQIAVSIKRMDF